ncbi:MAG: T9SS type A sorting domain-containing protein [candidate division KSB1 bacterium]|nr:T9SS type A sorting domain-containing protein [candidate division KSB1 bacterium]
MSSKRARRFIASTVALLVLPALALAGGTVYLVLGSDTAIWDGMDDGRYDCLYDLSLYTEPARNAYQVMAPAFRQRFVDSYGQPLKMTWWMMAGNIFRYARNTNVPVPNVMTMYLMKKYHGDNVVANGDELSLHYHTFFWSDYDGDGRWWWNQAHTFQECRDDFDVTLAQLLLEEGVFPVSFRSGWHYMDNDWQRYLNRLLPFSMHNDYPARGVDTAEPLDNVIDWSRAPSQWVPYHPSEDDYQVPGDGRGWNVRSAHFSTTVARGYLDQIFAEADKGIDQVACIWGHLPETDFLSNIAKVDSAAHAAAARYPGVSFRYCTAVEAMQRWLRSDDVQAPRLTVQVAGTAEQVQLLIQSDEPLFQPQPVVAFKDVYEDYGLVFAEQVGDKTWQVSLPARPMAKVGVAVCDTVGNQALFVHSFLPDDLFCDDESGELQPVVGSWRSVPQGAWGRTALTASVAAGDSAVVHWYPRLTEEGLYNVFVQVPAASNMPRRLVFRLSSAGAWVGQCSFEQGLPAGTWVYVGTARLSPGSGTFLEMAAHGDGVGRTAVADVAKFSALVRDRDLHVQPQVVDLGEVSRRDTVRFSLQLQNWGVEEVTVTATSSARGMVQAGLATPFTVPTMGRVTLPVFAFWPNSGAAIDSLVLLSDDPRRSRLSVPITARVQNYFLIVDNEDSLHYHEFGQWRYSVAQAYGPTSRYAPLNQTPRAYATFTGALEVAGVYELFEIVPTTVNTTNHALYEVSVAGIVLDSVVVDQNQGSGSWVRVGRYYFPAGVPVQVRVIDTGKNTNPQGVVLRADAIKFALVQEVTLVDQPHPAGQVLRFRLEQNYPNPCNAHTTIAYELGEESHVQLRVYNTAGQQVAILVDKVMPPGAHAVRWDAQDVPSGVYFYRLVTERHEATAKMIVLR